MDTLNPTNHPPHTPLTTPDEPSAGPSRPGKVITPSRPRVLMIKGLDTDLGKLSPFQRKQACDRLGKVVRCDRLKDGVLEVEFSDVAEAERALNISEISFYKRENGNKKVTTVKVSCVPHRTKNFCRGVIRCVELRGVTDDEIVDGLEEFGVVGARRVRTKRGGEERETDTVILTFDGLDLPEKIHIGYTKVNVRAYIPNPMRCFTCHRYGHTTPSCRGKRTCGQCGEPDHVAADCTSPTNFCVNCGEGQSPHTVFDRTCPTLLKEREIMNLKVKNRLSFREARDAYESTHPRRSYAQTVRAGAPTPPRVTPEECLRSLSVADFIRLAGNMGLVLSHRPAVPAPATAPPAPTPPPQGVGEGAPGDGAPPISEPLTPSASHSKSPPDSGGWVVVGRGGKTSLAGGRRPPSPVIPPDGGAAEAPQPPPVSGAETQPAQSAQTVPSTVAAMRKNFEEVPRSRSPTKRPAGSPLGQPQASRARGNSAESARGRGPVRNRLGGSNVGPTRGAYGGSGPPWKG